jgi:putative endopeptidase
MQAQIRELDLRLYFETMGYPVLERIILTEPRYFPVLSQMLRDRPIGDFRDYAALQLILEFQDVLTTGFEEPVRAFGEVLTGVGVLPPREERALGLIGEALGQPLSRIYVENFFSEETRSTAAEMIGRIEQVFRKRIPTRAWLTEATRAEALEKLDGLSFEVGYPGTWIDYSAVEIGSDPVANLMNIAAFDDARLRAKFDGPVEHDSFNARSTLPIAVNAAYDSTINGFEIPAAILQPPIFPADMDAPVYFCRLGGVIGHEMTHGFDSGGRLSDAGGNLRDWWTPEDAAAFESEAEKLIDQANAFEVLPGLTANGALNVRENMADVGGITFAYEALRHYLAEHPEEDVEIDGLTPAQRCFISWSQMWAGKSTEHFVRAIVATDGHPPLSYRAVASLQHVDAFYEAFGIEEGDPMWLPPEQRVHAG